MEWFKIPSIPTDILALLIIILIIIIIAIPTIIYTNNLDKMCIEIWWKLLPARQAWPYCIYKWLPLDWNTVRFLYNNKK